MSKWPRPRNEQAPKRKAIGSKVTGVISKARVFIESIKSKVRAFVKNAATLLRHSIKPAMVGSLFILGAWCILWAASQCTSEFLANTNSSCFEYWFNRYQTLVAALIALVAAYVASKIVWRQLAVQTYDTLQKYSDIIERDYRLGWQCRREARFSLLFEEGIKEIVSPVELGAWRETLLERQTKQRAIQDEIEVIAKEWSLEAGVALQEMGASLISLGARIDEQRDLVNSISVTHASGQIPSQWIVDKRKLKNSTASVEASALNKQAEKVIQLARAELLKVRQKLASTMKIILGA